MVIAGGFIGRYYACVNRFDFQELANLRITEATVLLHASLFDGAYYLAGYAIECALKACIARQTKQFDFPDRAIVTKSYTHNLVELVGVAGLSTALERYRQADEEFSKNWSIAKDWSEEARYQRYTEKEASDFLNAIADDEKGVLPWLKDHW